MKNLFLFIVLLIMWLTNYGQKPFYFNLNQPGYDYITDVSHHEGRFYLIQIRLENIMPYENHDAYSNLIILNEKGELLEKFPLHDFRSAYHRIFKEDHNNLYMVGSYKSDTCNSELAFVKYNIQDKSVEEIATFDFCDRKLTNLNIVQGLNTLFLDEYHVIGERFLKSVFQVDSLYNLKLIWDSLYIGETISVDFARTGYVKASVGLYDFYDRNFNFRKQRNTFEAFGPLHETHTPFGKNYILEQGVQHVYSKPDYGLQIRLVDSNLIIKKKIVMVPDDAYYGNTNTPFYGGIDIQNENEIWSAGTFGHLDYNFQRPSYYTISKLDSNLNVICQHFLGYDARYRLFGIRAFESGGAIVFGNYKYEGEPVNEGEDIFALRVGENCELPTVSTTDPHSLISISAYPNPAINSLTFDVNGFDPFSLAVEFFDARGSVLFSKKDLSYEIHVTDLPPGQYFYRITQGEKQLGVGAWVKQ